MVVASLTEIVSIRLTVRRATPTMHAIGIQRLNETQNERSLMKKRKNSKK